MRLINQKTGTINNIRIAAIIILPIPNNNYSNSNNNNYNSNNNSNNNKDIILINKPALLEKDLRKKDIITITLQIKY